MNIGSVVALWIGLFPLVVVAAEPEAREGEAPQEIDAKILSGMSILGNSEAPKALYIVPWKASDVGADIRLSSALTKDLAPIDRDVLAREIEYFELSNPKQAH